MEKNEIADAIDSLTQAVNGIAKETGAVEGFNLVLNRLNDINSSLGDVADAIRELAQEIGSEK